MSRGLNVSRCTSCGRQFVCGDCIRGTCPKCEGKQKAVQTLTGMCDEMNSAERLSNTQLVQALINEVWADFPVDSRKSALISEAIERLKRGR